MYVYLTTLASLALLAQASSEFEPILEARHGMSRHQSHHDVHKHRVIAEKAALLPAVASRKPLLPVHGKASPLLPTSSGLKLITSYTGAAFLDQSQWTYFTDPDPTHGIVDYVDQQTAVSSHLAYVNSAGNFVSAVDSTTQLAQGQGRKSVRITSTKTFNQGQLVLLDATHMPVGCSTWPAFWMVGTGEWPQTGEVDIIEGVSNSRSNQMTLHTTAGCTVAKPMNATGTIVGMNCDTAATNNESCGIVDADTRSWGANYNAIAGGVHATLWDSTGWTIWFFPRSSIPHDVTAGAPNPKTWPQPAAHWSSSRCPSHFFGNQSIVFDITLCGDWANSVFGQGDGCKGTCASAVADPKNFVDAFWSVKSLRIYQ